MALDNKVLENAKRLGLKDETAATMKEEQSDSPRFKERDQDAEVKEDQKQDLKEQKVKEDTDPDKNENEKGDKNVEKRIGRLVGKNKELQEKYDDLIRRFGEIVGTKDDNEPKVDDFATVDDFAKATKEYHARKAETQAKTIAYQKEQTGKLNSLIEKGKSAAEDLGITPEEYHDRIMDSGIKWFPAAKEELFDSEHGHLIAHDIAEHKDEFNALADKDTTKTGAKQVAWIAKREAHYARMDEAGKDDTKNRKVTKAAAPDSELHRGLGSPETDDLTNKDGSSNMKAARKLIKGRNRGFGY